VVSAVVDATCSSTRRGERRRRHDVVNAVVDATW
jgi:hypothetical protein